MLPFFFWGGGGGSVCWLCFVNDFVLFLFVLLCVHLFYGPGALPPRWPSG